MLSGKFAILHLIVANISFPPIVSSSIPPTPINNSMKLKTNSSLLVSQKSSINTSTNSNSVANKNAISNRTPQSSSSSLRLSASSLASSVTPQEGYVKVLYHYFAKFEGSGHATAANDVSFVNLFGSTTGGVLFVGQNSCLNMEESPCCALPRL